MRKNHKDNFSWLEAELNETYDEMFEAEFSEPMLPDEFWKIYKGERPDTLEKRTYFRNLLRLQMELIKLQDWVENTGSKVLIICEAPPAATITAFALNTWKSPVLMLNPTAPPRDTKFNLHAKSKPNQRSRARQKATQTKSSARPKLAKASKQVKPRKP